MGNLFDSFQSSSKADWLRKVEKDLKGKSIDALNWKVNENIELSPFAHADDLSAHYPPILNGKETNAWEIGEIIRVSNDPEKSNTQALEALENGVTALCFDIPHSLSKTALSGLLKDIQHDWISTHFVISPNYAGQLVTQFLEIVAAKQQDIQQIKGSLQIVMPLNAKVLPIPTAQLAASLPNFKLATIDGTSFYEDDTNMTTELAELLHLGNAYLAKMDMKLTKRLQFKIAIGKSYFVNISKIRAFKLLWQQILSAYGADWRQPVSIEGHLALSSMKENQYNNMIGSTTQAMSAIIAGVDRLYVLPADAKTNPNGTSFTTRIARNIQHLLSLESHLDHVVDPAAGSYHIETFTETIAEETWLKFQELEKNNSDS